MVLKEKLIQIIRNHKIVWITSAVLVIIIASYFGIKSYTADEVSSPTENNNELTDIQKEQIASTPTSSPQPANNSKDITTKKKVAPEATTPSSSNPSTEPPSSPTISQTFAFYGDTRTGHDAHRSIISSLLQHNFIKVMHVGDLVEDGNVPEQWTVFNDITVNIKDKLRPVLGNHENNSINFFNNFSLPNNERWYVLNYSTATIIALDTTSSISVGSEQYNWLNNTLDNLDDSKFTIIYFHHPPFSTGAHSEDPYGLRNSIVPLFENNGVDLVFNGHDHDYERSLYNGIYYIVVGGGGAPLGTQTRSSSYSQKFLSSYCFAIVSVNNSIDVKVYNQDNSLIDSIAISNR